MTYDDIPEDYREYAKNTKPMQEDKIDPAQKEALKQFVGKVMTDETLRQELKTERETSWKEAAGGQMKEALDEEEFLTFLAKQTEKYNERKLPPINETDERNRTMWKICQWTKKNSGITLADLDLKMKYDGIILKHQLELGEKLQIQ